MLKSPYTFKNYGECGLPVSELFAQHGSTHGRNLRHPQHARRRPQSRAVADVDEYRRLRLVRPSMGSWLTYGLGSENENLPAFVAMCPGGYPIKESQNWQNGFLPGKYQATYIDSAGERIEQLIDHIQSKGRCRSRST